MAHLRGSNHNFYNLSLSAQLQLTTITRFERRNSTLTQPHEVRLSRDKALKFSPETQPDKVTVTQHRGSNYNYCNFFMDTINNYHRVEGCNYELAHAKLLWISSERISTTSAICSYLQQLQLKLPLGEKGVTVTQPRRNYYDSAHKK